MKMLNILPSRNGWLKRENTDCTPCFSVGSSTLTAQDNTTVDAPIFSLEKGRLQKRYSTRNAVMPEWLAFTATCDAHKSKISEECTHCTARLASYQNNWERDCMRNMQHAIVRLRGGHASLAAATSQLRSLTAMDVSR